LGRLEKISLINIVGIFFRIEVVALAIAFGVVGAVTVFAVEWVANGAMLVAHATTAAISNVVAYLEVAQSAPVTTLALGVVCTVDAHCPRLGAFSNLTGQLRPESLIDYAIGQRRVEHNFTEAHARMLVTIVEA